ncbi:hypothetical protein [Myroides pelagicus]|uniref:Lipoprotein n=1 Tax=Myroides pelagicus TaxID=270914 RepID=A0A7K1GJG0_9FLAO|nr:hypothetical protein [Myroides pelagicus]MEC4112932.1 hypothetical protein [Myroides pelagicus]MTH28928.1 hypothetical protein [Myroides pelagicus]
MKIKLLPLILSSLFIITLFYSCDNQDISTSKAYDTVQSHLVSKPEYEKTTITVGEKRFRLRKDSLEVSKYRKLEHEGYIEFAEESSKKKWLSKDSIWNVTIKLTSKAHPYVINQNKDKITVKTIMYNLGDEDNLQLNNHSKKSATVSVMLIKEYTPFIILSKDASPNTKFITKNYKLRYNETNGWIIN